MEEDVNLNGLAESNLYAMDTQEYGAQYSFVNKACTIDQGTSQESYGFYRRAASFSFPEKGKPVNLKRALSSRFTKEGK